MRQECLAHLHCPVFLGQVRKILAGLALLGDGVMLVTRLYMARVFFLSGLTKIDDWDKTLFLFAEEYQVPLLPPALAAFMGTAAELACPVLLILGVGTRLATVPLLVMTAVIQFTYLNHPDHLVWAIMLAIILCFGPGRLSVDHWLRRKFLAA